MLCGKVQQGKEIRGHSEAIEVIQPPGPLGWLQISVFKTWDHFRHYCCPTFAVTWHYCDTSFGTASYLLLLHIFPHSPGLLKSCYVVFEFTKRTLSAKNPFAFLYLKPKLSILSFKGKTYGRLGHPALHCNVLHCSDKRLVRFPILRSFVWSPGLVHTSDVRLLYKSRYTTLGPWIGIKSISHEIEY